MYFKTGLSWILWAISSSLPSVSSSGHLGNLSFRMYKKARHMPLPIFAAAASSSCLFLYSPLSKVWAQIFPFPLSSFSLPASLQCLCTLCLSPSSPLSHPLCLHFLHFRVGIEADTRLPIPCGTEPAVWKEEAVLPSGGKAEFRVCLTLNMHHNVADQRSREIVGLWVLEACKDRGILCIPCAPHWTWKRLSTGEVDSGNMGEFERLSVKGGWEDLRACVSITPFSASAFSSCQIYTLIFNLGSSYSTLPNYPSTLQDAGCLGQVKDWSLIIVLLWWGDKPGYPCSMLLSQPLSWQDTKDRFAGFAEWVATLLRQAMCPAGLSPKWFCSAALGNAVMWLPNGQHRKRCLTVQQLPTSS